jgi:DNA relaxase NicK
MVIGSGATADLQGPFFLALADKCTRLDLAATLLDGDTHRDWTVIAYNQCKRDGRISSGVMKTHRIEGSPDGRTLYIGSRSSDRFVRIYDKTAESKGIYPSRTWRWEVEYKHPRSGVVSSRLAANGFDTAAKLDILRSGLEDLRVNLPVAGLHSGWLPKRPKLPTDDESRLRYAARVIGPFLTNLIRNVGEDRVTDALARCLLVRERVVSEPTGEITKQ